MPRTSQKVGSEKLLLLALPPLLASLGAVGEAVGEGVGRGVGHPGQYSVGVAVGLALGKTEGAGVGDAVGAVPVGDIVGRGDGSEVGCGVVGCAEGVGVGKVLGLGVEGEVEGAVVGGGDGAGDGAEVGLVRAAVGGEEGAPTEVVGTGVGLGVGSCALAAPKTRISEKCRRIRPGKSRCDDFDHRRSRFVFFGLVWFGLVEKRKLLTGCYR